MIEKVALVRALRETFVEDLGGMIDADEAWYEAPKNDIKDQPEPKNDDIIDIDNIVADDDGVSENINLDDLYD